MVGLWSGRRRALNLYRHDGTLVATAVEVPPGFSPEQFAVEALRAWGHAPEHGYLASSPGPARLTYVVFVVDEHGHRALVWRIDDEGHAQPFRTHDRVEAERTKAEMEEQSAELGVDIMYTVEEEWSTQPG